MKKIFLIALSILLLTILVAPGFVDAQGLEGIKDASSKFGEAGFGQSVDDVSGKNFGNTIGFLINIFLGFMSVVLLLVIIRGAFMYMTAGGNTDQVDKAKKWIINGVVGMILAVLAFFIAQYTTQVLTEAQKVSGFMNNLLS